MTFVIMTQPVIPEVRDWAKRCHTASGAQPDTVFQYLLGYVVNTLKTKGWWADLGGLYAFAATGNVANGAVNLVSSSYPLTIQNGTQLTWNPNAGVSASVQTSSAGYLTLGLSPSTLAATYTNFLNSNAIGVYVVATDMISIGSDVGASGGGVGGPYNLQIRTRSSTNSGASWNNAKSTSTIIIPAKTAVGLNLNVRTDSGNGWAQQGQTVTPWTQTADGLPTVNLNFVRSTSNAIGANQLGFGMWFAAAPPQAGAQAVATAMDVFFQGLGTYVPPDVPTPVTPPHAFARAYSSLPLPSGLRVFQFARPPTSNADTWTTDWPSGPCTDCYTTMVPAVSTNTQTSIGVWQDLWVNRVNTTIIKPNATNGVIVDKQAKTCGVVFTTTLRAIIATLVQLMWSSGYLARNDPSGASVGALLRYFSQNPPTGVSWTAYTPPASGFGWLDAVDAINAIEGTSDFDTSAWASLAPAPTSLSVSGAAAGAGGEIKLTVSSTSVLNTSYRLVVTGVGGTTEANGAWPFTIVDSTHIQLTGSTYVNTYTSGGIVLNPAPRSISVSGSASGGGGEIKLTVSTTSGLSASFKIFVTGVGGTTEANGLWAFTIVDSTHIQLTGSTYVHAYTSGGLIEDGVYQDANVNTLNTTTATPGVSHRAYAFDQATNNNPDPFFSTTSGNYHVCSDIILLGQSRIADLQVAPSRVGFFLDDEPDDDPNGDYAKFRHMILTCAGYYAPPNVSTGTPLTGQPVYPVGIATDPLNASGGKLGFTYLADHSPADLGYILEGQTLAGVHVPGLAFVSISAIRSGDQGAYLQAQLDYYQTGMSAIGATDLDTKLMLDMNVGNPAMPPAMTNAAGRFMQGGDVGKAAGNTQGISFQLAQIVPAFGTPGGTITRAYNEAVAGLLSMVIQYADPNSPPTVASGGAGYSLNDTINLAGGTTYTNPVILRVTGVSGGAVTAVTVLQPGSYTGTLPPDPTLQATSSGGGSGASFHVNWAIQLAQSVSLASGGSGYATNDLVVLAGGTFTVAAILRVTSVSSGAITGLSILQSGAYTSLPGNPVAQDSTSGSGNGATFNITWAVAP